MKKKENTVKKKKIMIGIGVKIAACFLIPLIFMLVIGASSYSKAEEGMNEKFRESTIQTIDMAKEYLDVSCEFVKAAASPARTYPHTSYRGPDRQPAASSG